MGDKQITGGEFLQSDQILKGLIRELKNPLLLIARSSELATVNSSAIDLAEIERTAEQALRLIDRYLLTAQSEYGQKMLPLAPVSLGSVFYEVSAEIESLARANNYELQVDTRHVAPVMVDSQATQAALGSLSQIMMAPHSGKKAKILRLSAFKKPTGQVLAGVLVAGAEGFTEAELVRAGTLQGNSFAALNKGPASSGIHLAIAQSLAKAMGGRVLPVKRLRMKGLGIELVKSEQLSLI